MMIQNKRSDTLAFTSGAKECVDDLNEIDVEMLFIVSIQHPLKTGVYLFAS